MKNKHNKIKLADYLDGKIPQPKEPLSQMARDILSQKYSQQQIDDYDSDMQKTDMGKWQEMTIHLLYVLRAEERAKEAEERQQRQHEAVIKEYGEVEGKAMIEREATIWQCVRDSNHTKSYFDCEFEITGKRSH